MQALRTFREFVRVLAILCAGPLALLGSVWVLHQAFTFAGPVGIVLVAALPVGALLIRSRRPRLTAPTALTQGDLVIDLRDDIVVLDDQHTPSRA